MAVFHKAATADEIPPGTGKRVDVEGWRVAIFNLDGRFYAIEDRCSHDEASLSEGLVEGDEVECPLHGARFDIRSGRVLSPPAVEDVRAFDLEIQGGQIFVALPARR